MVFHDSHAAHFQTFFVDAQRSCCLPADKNVSQTSFVCYLLTTIFLHFVFSTALQLVSYTHLR